VNPRAQSQLITLRPLSRLLGGGPASSSRVTTSVVVVVVVVVVFALFVRSLSLSMGFALFLVRSLFSVGPWGSVRRARSVHRFVFWQWFDPIYTHPSSIDRHLHPSVSSFERCLLLTPIICGHTVMVLHSRAESCHCCPCFHSYPHPNDSPRQQATTQCAGSLRTFLTIGITGDDVSYNRNVRNSACRVI
jgi:hypothetical protein